MHKYRQTGGMGHVSSGGGNMIPKTDGKKKAKFFLILQGGYKINI